MLTPAYSQDNRTLETRVADILAQFPAQNAEYTNRLMAEIISLGPDGIARFCDMIIPPGTGDDVQARYALGSLARYAGAPGHDQDRKIVETSLLAALDKATDNEVKAFFIRRLALCGSSAATEALEKYVNSPVLYAPAIATLTSIGTDEAAGIIARNLDGKTGDQQIALIKAIGQLHHDASEPYLVSLAGKTADPVTLRVLYGTLAELGGKDAADVLKEAAQRTSYAPDPTETMVSYLLYASRLGENGESKLSHSVCLDVLKHCTGKGQLQYRSSALEVLRKNEGTSITGILLKEARNEDKAYRNAVLRIAGEGMTATEVDQWIGAMKKMPPETRAEILHLLSTRHEEAVLQETILPSLSSNDPVVRREAILALAVNQGNKAVPVLLNSLKNAGSPEDYPVIEKALLTVCGVNDSSVLAAQLGDMNDAGKVVLVHVLASRRATTNFNDILNLCSSPSGDLRQAAFDALATVSAPENIKDLTSLLEKTGNPAEIKKVQVAIENLYQDENPPETKIILDADVIGIDEGQTHSRLTLPERPKQPFDPEGSALER